MDFEFAPDKSEANQHQHGIKHRMRIISVRRARDEEVAIYEG